MVITPADMEDVPLLNCLAGISPATMFHHTHTHKQQIFGAFCELFSLPPQNLPPPEIWPYEGLDLTILIIGFS